MHIGFDRCVSNWQSFFVGGGRGVGVSVCIYIYLCLELLVLFFLGRPVLLYLLLGLVTGLLDALRPVLPGCNGATDRGPRSAQVRLVVCSPRVGGWEGARWYRFVCVHFWTILEASFSACGVPLVSQMCNRSTQLRWIFDCPYLEEGLDTRGVLGRLPSSCYYC
jgi:hypothetical protein